MVKAAVAEAEEEEVAVASELQAPQVDRVTAAMVATVDKAAKVAPVVATEEPQSVQVTGILVEVKVAVAEATGSQEPQDNQAEQYTSAVTTDHTRALKLLHLLFMINTGLVKIEAVVKVAVAEATVNQGPQDNLADHQIAQTAVITQLPSVVWVEVAVTVVHMVKLVNQANQVINFTLLHVEFHHLKS